MALRELGRLRTTIRVRPRYAETDQMGVVYHANYLVWFHEARDAMLAAVGVDLRAAERDGHAFPVTESHCRHHAPAHYGEDVLVSAVPLRDPAQGATVARLRVHYRVEAAKGRRLLAQGETVNVITDRTGRMLLRIPACFESLVRVLAAADAGHQEVMTQ